MLVQETKDLENEMERKNIHSVFSCFRKKKESDLKKSEAWSKCNELALKTGDFQIYMAI